MSPWQSVMRYQIDRVFGFTERVRLMQLQHVWTPHNSRRCPEKPMATPVLAIRTLNPGQAAATGVDDSSSIGAASCSCRRSQHLPSIASMVQWRRAKLARLVACKVSLLRDVCFTYRFSGNLSTLIRTVRVATSDARRITIIHRIGPMRIGLLVCSWLRVWAGLLWHLWL